MILSTIFNAIGCRVEVEKMIATGRIDMVVEVTNFIYVLELKLSNNGGVDACPAISPILRWQAVAIRPTSACRRSVFSSAGSCNNAALSSPFLPR